MKNAKVKNFLLERDRLNKLVMECCGKNIKRFYSIDSSIYQDGALSRKEKELLGLVASLVLRCDDCITYHLIKCRENGVSNEELDEALSVGLVVGGSVVIPHLRRALEVWNELCGGEK